MSGRLAMLAALAASLGVASLPMDPPSVDPRKEPPEPEPGGPCDGRTITVPHAVYVEVLKAYTLAQINAMPYAERLPIIEAAAARVEAMKRGDGDAAALLRAERERRKAEAWAKRQPKGKA